MQEVHEIVVSIHKSNVLLFVQILEQQGNRFRPIPKLVIIVGLFLYFPGRLYAVDSVVGMDPPFSYSLRLKEVEDDFYESLLAKLQKFSSEWADVSVPWDQQPPTTVSCFADNFC